MGQGGVGVFGYDRRKAVFRRAVFTVIFFNGPGYVGLVAAHGQDGRQPGQHIVVELHRSLDPRYFLLVFDDAQLLHQSVGLPEVQARFDPAHVIPRQDFGFKAHHAGSLVFDERPHFLGRRALINEYPVAFPQFGGSLFSQSRPLLVTMRQPELSLH